MKKTVGKYDRAVRGVLAMSAIIGSAILGFSSGWGIVLIVVAAIMVITGTSGYCPAYSVVGIDTRAHDASGKVGGTTGSSVRA